ncbi:helix-turn-helix domain-containing protein [Streptomyces sp. NPDC005708]|uniref:PucR family transcriptional regulator n=1 Tax=Streptomyces sp. NPDC005708 TaxID=3154564 RepID=UPI003401E5E4
MSSTHAGLRQFIREIRRDRDKLVRFIVNRIRAEVYEYREVVSSEVITELAAHVEGHLRIYVEILESQTGHPDEQHFEFVQGAARLRVGQGITSENLIRSFSSATSALWTWLVDNGWLEGERALTMSETWPIWFQYLNEANARIAAVYREAEIERFADGAAVRANFVGNLLQRKVCTIEARRSLIEFGFGADDTFGLVLLRTDQTDERLAVETRQRLARAVSSRLESMSGVRPLMLLRDDEIVLVHALRGSPQQLCDDIRKATSRITKPGELVGVVSEAFTDIRHLDSVHAVAYRALRVLTQRPRLALITEISLLEFAIAALGSDVGLVCPPRVARFVRAAEADHPDWIDTVRVWAQSSMNVKHTAAAMQVHVNTVYYRLNQITKTAGIDVYDLEQVVGLLIAIELSEHLAQPTL